MSATIGDTFITNPPPFDTVNLNQSVTLTWRECGNTNFYRVEVIYLPQDSVIYSELTEDTTLTLPGTVFNIPETQYNIKVQAVNVYILREEN